MTAGNKQFEKLKQRAKKLAQKKVVDVDFSSLTAEQLREKLQQAEIYKIELEIQNQELQDAQDNLLLASRTQRNLTTAYQNLFDDAPVGYLLLDQRGLIVQVNQAFYQMSGLTEHSTIGRSFSGFILEQFRKPFIIRYPAFYKNPEQKTFETVLSTPSGDTPVVVKAARVRDHHIEETLLRIVVLDMTEQVKLRGELDLHSKFFEVSQLAGLITNSEGKIISVNDSFTRITGYKIEDVYLQFPTVFAAGENNEQFYKVVWPEINDRGYWSGQIQAIKKDGEVFDISLTIDIVRSDSNETTNFIGSFADITKEIESSNMIEHLAQYDQLTNLPNRSLLDDRLSQLIKHAQRDGFKIAVLFMDLDNFKSLNDTQGHLAGDELLIKVAERMQGVFRESDTICRFGGDEFVVVINSLNENDDVRALSQQLAKKLLQCISEPYVINDHHYNTTFSIGISLYPDNADNAEMLIQHADVAMYEAKANGRNGIAFFNTDLKDLITSETLLDRELHNALSRNELRLYFQPQIDLRTGELTSAEALIRWMHPTKGLIGPDKFLNTAEKLGLINEIDEWVMAETCQQLALWAEREITYVPVSINLTYHQFSPHSRLVSNLKGLLKKYQISSSKLHIEVLETGLMKNIQSAQRVLM